MDRPGCGFRRGRDRAIRADVLSALDLSIPAAFFAYCIFAGLRSRRISSRNLEEYFLAGRSLRGWKAGLSMAATQFAADTPLLVTGLIATAGIFSLWRLWIYAIAFLMMGFLLAGPWQRAGVLTDAELAEVRYGSRLATVLRVLKAIYFGTIFNCTVLAMVLFAATQVAAPFVAWDAWLPSSVFDRIVQTVAWLGISPGPAETTAQAASNLLSLLAVVSVTAFYSTTGGLRAVVRTDVVQFAIAIAGTAVYAGIVAERVGGLRALPARLAALYGEDWTAATLAFTPDLARDASLPVLAVIAVQWLAQMNADGTGYLAQRTMACRSERDARQAAVVFVGAQVLLRSLLWLPIGLGLLVLLPVHDDASVGMREATFAEGIALYLPPGAKGLMLTGLLAALASTIDTHLNWGASYWTNDIYRRVVCGIWLRREPSGPELVWVARASNLGILAGAIAILTQLGSIQSAWQTSLLLGAGMGIPLVLRWLWWRMSAAAELAAIAASSLLAPILLTQVDGDAARLLIMTGTSALVVVLVAWWLPEEETRAAEFYRRVRPPGWWRPVADDGGAAHRRLRSGAGRTAAATLATFCLLVAAGSWLVGSPPPVIVPSARAWTATLALIGLVLAAGVYRAVRRTVH